MTNNKSPFKKSLQPWFLFSHKTRKYMPLNNYNYSLLLHHNTSSLGINRTMFETKFSVKMSSEQWCKMHPTLTSPIPSLIIIIVEILNDKKYLNSKLLHYRSENYKTTLMWLYSLRTFQWYQECNPQFPKKFRSEFCQMLSHEKYSKFNGQKGQQKFHLHPIKV
jgi:hypothetical protein